MDPLQDALTRPDGIAARLLAMREQAGILAKDVADRAGWHPSKASRFENGRRVPTATDVRTWGAACNADQASIDAVLVMLSEAQTDHRRWRMRTRQGQGTLQHDYTELTAATKFYREFNSFVIPGLLQTAAYARATQQQVRALHQVEGSPAGDVDAAVEERMRRAQLLYDDSHKFEFLIDEGVLWRHLASPAVMRGQLDRLQTIIGLPNVRFGILPFLRELTVAPVNSVSVYVLAEESFAEVELFPGAVQHREEAELAATNHALDTLWENAIEGEECRQRITAVARVFPD